VTRGLRSTSRTGAAADPQLNLTVRRTRQHRFRTCGTRTEVQRLRVQLLNRALSERLEKNYYR